MRRLHDPGCPGWYQLIPRAFCCCSEPETRLTFESQSADVIMLAVQQAVDVLRSEHDGLHICRACHYGMPPATDMPRICPRCAACSWLYYPADLRYLVHVFSARALKRFAAIVQHSSEVMYGKSIES